jgi:hypothetical protein
MTAERHADDVRSYLDYLCRSADQAEVIAWSSWVGRTMGATAMVSLTLGVGSCAPTEYMPAFDTGGTGPTGGSGAVGTGGSGAMSTGGIAGNAGMTLYGMPPGGQATGGTKAEPTGGKGTAGMGALYAIPSGGTGGARTDGSGGIIGGMATTPMYGVPTVGG